MSIQNWTFSLLLAVIGAIALGGCGDDTDSSTGSDAGGIIDGGRIDGGGADASDIDAGPRCGAQTLCGDLCVSTDTDRNHCGGCGTVCESGEVCSGGTCGLSCGGSTPTLCGDACVDADTDRNNCGGCDDGAGSNTCAAGEVCSDGTCGLSCGGSTPTLCDDACVDTDTDRNHCGGCDDGAGSNTCAAGEVCSDGTCGLSCGGDTPTLCGDACVDTDTDRSHCGGCDDGAGSNTCAAGEICSDGTCGLSCGGDTPTLCGDSCVDTDTDRSNCGRCGTACAAGEVCSDGTCGPSCAAPLEECNNMCVNTDLNPSHCGGCGTVCSLPNTANAGCFSGNCFVASCESGFGDCDSDPSNGCEQTGLDSDPNNCGACNRVCDSGMCRGGECLKVSFVTSTMTNGDIGGLDGGDAFCQMHADAAGFNGTYRAWLSTAAGSPSTRFTRSSVPYVLVDGTVIADDYADLTGAGLDALLNLTELGGAAPVGNTSCGGGGFLTVWSATNRNGTAQRGDVCGGFTSTSGGGLWGLASSTTSWSSWCSGGLCSWTSPVYCFEQ